MQLRSMPEKKACCSALSEGRCVVIVVLEYSYRGCQSYVTQIDHIGLMDVLRLLRSLRTTGYGLRTTDYGHPGSLEPLGSLIPILYRGSRTCSVNVEAIQSILCCALYHYTTCDFNMSGYYFPTFKAESERRNCS